MKQPNIKSIMRKASSGRRLDAEEGLNLFKNADLLTMGELANRVKKMFHPDRLVTFVVDRNINYTNICINKCTFCAFWRNERDSDSYLLDSDTLFRKIDETIALGGTQILLQGGLHPSLGLDYYTDLLASIKKRF